MKSSFVYLIFVISLYQCNVIYAMTRQQLKNSGKLMKKSCIPKNDVTEEQVGKIEQGKFLEERNVMCYIACIYSMTQVIKNNKLSYEAVIKQVDLMFPPDMKDAVKAVAEKCKDVGKKYKDICEASYWTAKCMYDHDPQNFMTRAQLKKTMTIMKNQCMPKNGVTNEQVGKIEQGVFLEDHDVMCYIACVYKTAQVVKNNRLDKDMISKQIDVLYPVEIREPILSRLIEMDPKDFSIFIILAVLAGGTDSMTRQQLKKSTKMLKNNCMAKNDVTEDMVGDIEKGKFIQEKSVMCYIACIYQMSQIVKNNKLNYEASLKQVDIMFPPDMKEAMKSSIEKCKDISKKYKDICEASYWTAKCIYDDNPKNFVFP
ncbi:uncharacterized protein LOC124535899 [Vanessa cardui]|uniref:uncharacterized protein LOC124535899 n=1 Tax=Vanessa cardui TaxID=171605 RepID=UPI001F12EEBB|nr:uncharacterized protein LOC124535899 [Vanessa cardui]